MGIVTEEVLNQMMNHKECMKVCPWYRVNRSQNSICKSCRKCKKYPHILADALAKIDADMKKGC